MNKTTVNYWLGKLEDFSDEEKVVRLAELTRSEDPAPEQQALLRALKIDLRDQFDNEVGDVKQFDVGRQDAIEKGVKLRAKTTRGTGSRDKDTVLIEGRGEDASEAAEEFEDALTKAEENEWIQRVRNLEQE